MKITHYFKQLTLVVTLSFFVFSCNNDDDGYSAPEEPQSTTITALASESNDLSILVSALQAAGLDSTLDSEGSFTVFAPTNAAFENFLADNNFSGLSDIPVDVLTQVLLNHVIAGEVFSTSLTTSYGSTLATKNGSGENLSIYIDTSNGVTLNGVSNVSVADVDASNGVIHIVDAVIGLPNIVDHAVANPNLTSLVGALTADGNTTFTGLLSTPGDFTVFAPTNDAFAKIDAETLTSLLEEKNQKALANILTYHVVPGKLTATDVVAALKKGNGAVELKALNGQVISVMEKDGKIWLKDTSGNMSEITATDVMGSNGVIHVIDSVIMPK
jgi:transforming growth factor-beta-induced protein